MFSFLPDHGLATDGDGDGAEASCSFAQQVIFEWVSRVQLRPRGNPIKGLLHCT